jgi:hypothetical protein
MAKHAFTLQGLTQQNDASVKVAISSIPGVSASLTNSARGEHVLFADSELSEGEVRSLINAALNDLGASLLVLDTSGKEF